MSSDLIPSISIPQVLSQRNAAVEDMKQVLVLAQRVQKTLEPVNGHCALSTQLFTVRAHGYRAFDCEDDVTEMTRSIDSGFWDFLLKRSGHWQLMDAQRRDEWKRLISKGDVPELTEENIRSTFQSLHDERSVIFERGVLNVFKRLSWDFKTNLPVKFGKRFIMTRMLDVWKRGGHQSITLGFDGPNELDDLLRVMMTLDGKPEPATGTFRILQDLGWEKTREAVSLHDLISVKGFQNGNAHVTFLREDLVDKLNLIVAKHHPNALPPARES